MPAKSRAQQRLMGLAYGNPEIRKQIGIKKKDARDFAKTKHAGLPERVSEAMNFTEFCDSLVEPLYEKEGVLPKCPPGYRYDPNLKTCVPKTPKDSVGKGQKSGDRDLKPGQSANYNIWGNTGYDGSGYAWEEPPTSNDKATGNYE